MMPPNPLILCLAALAAILPMARAQDSAAPIDTYMQWHDACLAGDTDCIDTQIERFETRLAKHPDDQLARAFLGSACALRAKAGIWPPTRLTFLKLGKKHLDSAVAAAPADARVRMVRAIAYFKVPTRFGVRPTALKDFEILVPIAKNPGGGLKANERQAILYHAHLAYQDAGRPGAAELAAACHRISPESHYGKLTR